MNDETTKDSISALREQTALAKTRLHGVLHRFVAPASWMMQAVKPLAVLTAASILAVGCAGTAPAPDTGVEPERTPAPIVRETPRPATTTPVRASFAYAPGSASYVVTTEATIAEIDSADGASRTFREVARLQLGIAPADSQVIVTTTGSVEATTSASIIQSFGDTLRVGSPGAMGEPEMPICGRDTVPPMHLVTLLPPVPQELSEGVRWQRRSVYASCQGMIPVRVERTDSYVVTGSAPHAGRTGVTITRTSSLSYAGTGVEGQHNVRITGAGSGQGTLVLDAAMGRMLSAREEIAAEIGIAASGRTRSFSQRIVRTVTLQ